MSTAQTTVSEAINQHNAETPVPAPDQPARKWTSVAGPIQTKKVNKALEAIISQHNHITELNGVHGMPETERRSTFYVCFGGGMSRPDVVEALKKIGERFDYTVTRENYQDVVKAAEEALPALVAAIPVQDKRITQAEHQERERLVKERQAKHEQEAKAKAVVQDKIRSLRPSWAYALIVAVLHEDASESQSDYHAHKTTRTVAIGWRSGKREDFAQLRAAAAKFEPTADLGPSADANEVEHRDNWSMGGGNYVKRGGHHSSGWCVKSVDASSRDGSFYVPNDLEFAFPEVQEAPQGASGSATGASGATVTLNADKNGVEVRFPSKPSQETISQLKGHGFRWTFKGGGVWYHRQDERSIAFAHSLAGTQPPAVKQEQQRDRFDEQVEDNMAAACGL